MPACDTFQVIPTLPVLPPLLAGLAAYLSRLVL